MPAYRARSGWLHERILPALTKQQLQEIITNSIAHFAAADEPGEPRYFLQMSLEFHSASSCEHDGSRGGA
jgi:hypothetical protein